MPLVVEDPLDEFCRHCGITVSWTGEEWVHDYPPEEEHDPKVPQESYFEEEL